MVVQVVILALAMLNPNPPNLIEGALERDVTGKRKGPYRRIWDGRGR